MRPNDSLNTLSTLNQVIQRNENNNVRWFNEIEEPIDWKDKISVAARAALSCPFGKHPTNIGFTQTPGHNQILLLVLKSGFLPRSDPVWDTHRRHTKDIDTILQLVDDYGDVDFNPIRGYQTNWDKESSINRSRVTMMTACLMYFDFDIVPMMRWIQGPYTAQHRDHQAILDFTKGKIPDRTWDDLQRIFFEGAPAACHGESSPENFQKFFDYKNHKSVDIDPSKMDKAVLKDFKSGFVFLFDQRVGPFIVNGHFSPHGLTDIDHPYKNPRPFVDSSWLPDPTAQGINSWTSSSTEPDLEFPEALNTMLIWLYRLRLTFPEEEILIGDDDVKGAFRWVKYTPFLVAMHAFQHDNFVGMYAGQTFGDTTSPQNFEPIPIARRELAKWLWHNAPNRTIEMALPYLPELETILPPTDEEIAEFTPADPDPPYLPAVDEDGNPLAPRYHHHVDDNPYAHLTRYMLLTICASALSLWLLLGFPDPRYPDPLSRDKFLAFYNFLRKVFGWNLNSRKLTICPLAYKLEQGASAIDTLWNQPDLGLLELASLHGQIQDLTRMSPWMRPWFFAVQNAISDAIKGRYHMLIRSGKPDRIRKMMAEELPPSFAKKLEPLVQAKVAKLIWNSKARIGWTKSLRAALNYVRRKLRGPIEAWETPIGLVIPRTPHMECFGDASCDGGGAVCHQLQFIIIIEWDTKIMAGCRLKPGQKGFVHINHLEFIMEILEVAAIRTRLETMSPELERSAFPKGRPHLPIAKLRVDNKAACTWGQKFSTAAKAVQDLLRLYAALMVSNDLGIMTEWISTKDNKEADDISRPYDFRPRTIPILPFTTRLSQIFQKHSSLSNYEIFLPSQSLLQQIFTLLFSGNADQPDIDLPKTLGSFVPVSTITGNLPRL